MTTSLPIKWCCCTQLSPAQ